jgi:FMN phosphatase YigB (HAD superfamily)
MITSVLLDLDDTLLSNNMDTFLPAYLKVFGRYMADIIPPEIFIEEILNGTMKMYANTDPEITLDRAFADHFFPAVGHAEADLLPRLESFYSDVFPSLRELTSPRPDAVDLVESLFELELDIVIATNPLFPRTAVEQRLGWAGLSSDKFPYAQVTSYEQYHFTKPSPVYYAEILGRIGKTPGVAVMVGNDPANDLVPAQTLGITVFHVDADPRDDFPAGGLSDILPWIENLPETSQPAIQQNTLVIGACLNGQLAALRSMMSDVNVATWARRPSDDNWAPVEIVAHLRDVDAEVSLPRIHAILSEDTPLIQAVDPDSWTLERGYINESGPNVLESFTKIRKELIDTVGSLDAKALSRPAIHALLGPTTLGEIITIMTEHDLIHLDQLRRTLELV